MSNDVQQCREAASKGGKKTAELHGAAFREKRAQLGGAATVARYGREYMRELVNRRYRKNG